MSNRAKGRERRQALRALARPGLTRRQRAVRSWEGPSLVAPWGNPIEAQARIVRDMMDAHRRTPGQHGEHHAEATGLTGPTPPEADLGPWYIRETAPPPRATYQAAQLTHVLDMAPGAPNRDRSVMGRGRPA